MRELIASILSVEELSRDVYRAAAGYFVDDRDFATFLDSLARDEALHADTIKRAFEIVDRMPHRPVKAFKPSGTKTSAMRDRVSDVLEKLRAGALGKREMIDCVLDIEMSEWNELFLYVVDVLKDQNRQFQHLASHIQSHKEDVVRSCRTSCEGAESPHPLDEVPAVWTRRTLVVDDEPAIANMLTRVLRDTTNIELARDGKEAVEQVRRRYYDAIISDVNMPVVNGIEFLERAREIDPDIGKRFLFFTADLSEEHSRFLTANQIGFLDKPASITSIRNALQEILNRKG